VTQSSKFKEQASTNHLDSQPVRSSCAGNAHGQWPKDINGQTVMPKKPLSPENTTTSSENAWAKAARPASCDPSPARGLCFEVAISLSSVQKTEVAVRMLMDVALPH